MWAQLEYREAARRLSAVLGSREDLRVRYRLAKNIVRVFRRPAFYEIATRCNLRCEGCYYFEGGHHQKAATEAPLHQWEAFFASEAARGVSMAYFVGAEPALEQDRLILAGKYFPHGNIGTNGTIRLDPEIPFRIGVSIWGGSDATDATLRGASVFRKALRNYEGDARAIMLYTVSAWNIDEVRTVAEMCRDHGVKLTFNIYSPTQTFLEKLAAFAGHDDSYFRVSTPANSPCLTTSDLLLARQTLRELIDEFPQTVVYSHAYNRWVTKPGPRYGIDPETGIAKHCGSRMVDPLRYYTTDLQQRQVKCCTPDVDCSQCRMYSGGWSSKFAPQDWNLQSVEAFEDWLDMIEVLGRIFVMDRSPLKPTSEAAVRNAELLPL